MHQESQGLQSTKQIDSYSNIENINWNTARLKGNIPLVSSIKKLSENDIKTDAFPLSPVPNIKSNDICYLLIRNSKKEIGYIDLTGCFPYRSAKGNQYLLISYHFDANAIHAHPLKNRESTSITAAWISINKKLNIAGIQPNTYIINNEASLELKTAMKKENITHQLVPPNNHCANLAEYAIQTFKSHFKAALSIADPDFPLAQWDLLLEQVNITLNLPHSTHSNSKL